MPVVEGDAKHLHADLSMLIVQKYRADARFSEFIEDPVGMLGASGIHAADSHRMADIFLLCNTVIIGTCTELPADSAQEQEQKQNHVDHP